LTSIWINYYASRASLAQQLGVMDLDENGIWVEKPFELASRSRDEELPLPPPVPQEWLDHLEEIDPPPPLPRDADIKVQDPPGMLPGVFARALPVANEADAGLKKEQSESIQQTAAESDEQGLWGSLIPAFLR